MANKKIILNKVLMTIHFMSASMTVFCYIFLIHKSCFNYLTSISLSVYFISAIILYLLFNKSDIGWGKTYFKIISLLALAYIGLWIVLGFLIMH